jgi:NDP-sugar pyrophosphorylase family protein
MPDVPDTRVAGCQDRAMSGGVAGVVLAAGAGTRLRPLTRLRPKALCPVGGVPLVDLAIARVRPAVGEVAVNVHHGRAALEAHLSTRPVHVSVEAEEALGTAGALGHLRRWLDGRPALVVNADAWCPGDLVAFVDGWDGERIRLLVVGDDALTPTSSIAGALMPPWCLEGLSPEPSGLYEAAWADAQERGRVDVVRHDGPFVDCGTPAQYLAANLAATGGESVVGEGAVVAGTIDRTVVWPNAVVWPGEHLHDAIRADDRMTVLVR